MSKLIIRGGIYLKNNEGSFVEKYTKLNIFLGLVLIVVICVFFYMVTQIII